MEKASKQSEGKTERRDEKRLRGGVENKRQTRAPPKKKLGWLKKGGVAAGVGWDVKRGKHCAYGKNEEETVEGRAKKSVERKENNSSTAKKSRSETGGGVVVGNNKWNDGD